MGEPLQYLDRDRLDAVESVAFRARRPYPWITLEQVLTDSGFQRLRESLPEAHRLTPRFGIARAHGQRSHDRYALEYRPDLDVAPCWHEFVRELQGATYRRFLVRLTGERGTQLAFHWHYTPRGCEVSPHCDNKAKIGSHIFYFNTEADWNPSWGGETLILDDGGRFDRRSAPRFEDFEQVRTLPPLGNRSLLFARRANSWHGVREIQCPEGAYRKVFIVVLNHWSAPLRAWLRRGRGADEY
jgi:hypothetical protein